MEQIETFVGPNHDGAITQNSLAIGSPCHEVLVDYTTVEVGCRITGHLVTGHRTKSTVRCQKCGRVGVLAVGKRQRLVVHRGRASEHALQALDYCELRRGK